MRRLALGSLSDGRLQLWCTDTTQSSLYTCWKEINPTDAVQAGWTPWQPFHIPPNAFGGISDIAALKGPDGRLQLWYVSGPGDIFICRKSTLDSNSAWEAWKPFPQPPLTAPNNLALTAAWLPDQCTQLFLSAGGEGLWTISQLYNLNNPNVDAWSGWVQFAASPTPNYPIQKALMAGWGLAPNGTELFQYSGTNDGVTVYFNPGGPNPGWQTDGYPWTIGPGTVTAIAAVSPVVNSLQAFIAETDQNGLGHIRTRAMTSSPPNSGWSDPSDFGWNMNPVDCLATGQLQDGTGQMFASAGENIQTCWTVTAGPFVTWSAWQSFQTPAFFYFPSH